MKGNTDKIRSLRTTTTKTLILFYVLLYEYIFSINKFLLSFLF